MQTARIASIAFVALIFPVAALVFPFTTRAASGNVQVCQPSSSCQVGEFLYDDDYSPITSATCTITSRKPDGSFLLNASAMTASAQNDGWYSKDVSTPATEGLYRTQVCCTSGSDYMCLDKSFEVRSGGEGGGASAEDVANAVWSANRGSHNTPESFGAALQNIVPSTGDIAGATWDYSSRSLSTFGDLVSNVWNYSSTSNDDIGDLVANIWNHDTRTLTGADLTTGSLALKTDVTGSTTINTVNNITAELTKTNNMLEEITKKPVIENSLGSDTSFTLESKIDTTRGKADLLASKVKYIRSKAGLLDSKWETLKSEQISKSLTDISFTIGSAGDTTDKSSVLGASAWIGEQWGWQEADKTISQAKSMQSKLSAIQNEVDKKGKSAKARKDLKSVIALAGDIDKSLGKSLKAPENKLTQVLYPQAKTKTLYSRISEVSEIAQSYNSKKTELAKIFVSALGSSAGFEKQVDQLSKDIADLNFIPKLSKNILAKADSGEKGFKNKILSLLGMVDANKQFLAKKPEDTLSSTWLELGSIVFKTLISNPSEKITQEVPVKYYLPKEIKRENILEIDSELTVNFDAEKDQYYASGNFELKPGESKTLAIRVDDAVYAFNEDEINGIKKQAEELSEPLKNTSYFAQGATLKSDIDVSLNKVLSLQKSANTPEEKIRAYREGKILMDATNEKMDKLKEIATSAGSVNTLFGFVGGAQVLAVWGLVIILVSGFVFLALYMKMIRGGSKGEGVKVKGKGSKEKVSFDEEFEQEERKSRGHKGFKLAAIAVVALVGVGLIGGFAAMNFRGLQAHKTQVSSAGKETASVVLGEATESAKLQEDLKGEEVKLFVPNEASVSVHKEASLDSEVLINLELSQTVLKVSAQDGWARIIVDRGASEKITGWVDTDFIESPEVVTEKTDVTDANDSPVVQETKKIVSGILKLVTVLDTPTGFLRVRSAPGGKELGKLDPGKKYPVLDSKSGWLNILLDDGTLGWVSGKYTDFNGAKATGGQISPQDAKNIATR